MKTKYRFHSALILLLGTMGVPLYASLGEAHLKRVLKEVYIHESASDQADYRVAKAGEDTLSGSQVLRTGVGSRAELVFDNQSIARIGGSSTFSFQPEQQELFLGRGLLLYQVPKGTSGKTRISTATATASITGTTVLVEVTDGITKMIVLEGSMRVSIPSRPGEFVDLVAGQLLLFPSDSTRLPDPVDIDISRLIATSDIFTNGTGGAESSAGADSEGGVDFALVEEAAQGQQDEIESKELRRTELFIPGRGSVLYLEVPQNEEIGVIPGTIDENDLMATGQDARREDAPQREIEIPEQPAPPHHGGGGGVPVPDPQPDPDPDHAARPPLISNPDPFILDGDVSIVTNPHILKGDESYEGMIYEAEYGSTMQFAYGVVNEADEALGLDESFGGGETAWFRFSNLEVAGNFDQITVANGVESVGMISEGSLTFLKDEDADYAFPGIKNLFLTAANGITIGENTEFWAVNDPKKLNLTLYNRSTETPMVFESGHRMSVNLIEVYSAGDIIFNQGSISGTDSDMRDAIGVTINALGNLSFIGIEDDSPFFFKSPTLYLIGENQFIRAGSMTITDGSIYFGTLIGDPFDLNVDLLVEGDLLLTTTGNSSIINDVDDEERPYVGIEVDYQFPTEGRVLQIGGDVHTAGDGHFYIGDNIDSYNGFIRSREDEADPEQPFFRPSLDLTVILEGNATLQDIVAEDVVSIGNIDVENLVAQNSLEVAGNVKVSEELISSNVLIGGNLTAKYINDTKVEDGNTTDGFYSIMGDATIIDRAEVGGLYVGGDLNSLVMMTWGEATIEGNHKGWYTEFNEDAVIRGNYNYNAAYGFDDSDSPTIKVGSNLKVEGDVIGYELSAEGISNSFGFYYNGEEPITRPVTVEVLGDITLKGKLSVYSGSLTLRAPELIFDGEVSYDNDLIGIKRVVAGQDEFTLEDGEIIVNSSKGGDFTAISEGNIILRNGTTIEAMGWKANPDGDDFVGDGGKVQLIAQDGYVSIEDATILISDDSNPDNEAGSLYVEGNRPAVDGVSIRVTSSAQIKAIAENSEVFLRANQGNIEVDGAIWGDKIVMIANGANSVIRIGPDATIVADILKAGALGENGALIIGGPGVNKVLAATEQLHLYANTTSGLVRFAGDATLVSNDLIIAGRTVQVDQGATVNVVGVSPGRIYADEHHYNQGSWGDIVGDYNVGAANAAPAFAP